MKIIGIITSILFTLSFGSLSFAQDEEQSQEQEQQQVQSGQMSAEETYKDIEKILGFVPAFFKEFPEEGISGAWSEMKNIQLSENTELSPKEKELIGLAVAAQIPCGACVKFHSEVAKAHGASEKEVKEAAAIAAITRHWSTYLNGVSVDMDQFNQDVEKLVNNIKEKDKLAE